jgi:hypothetical protein
VTQNNQRSTKHRTNVSIHGDRIEQTQQLSLMDYFNSPKNFNTLTTEQICNCLEIPDLELKKCRIGGFRELDSHVILHKGRNRWRLLKT